MTDAVREGGMTKKAGQLRIGRIARRTIHVAILPPRAAAKQIAKPGLVGSGLDHGVSGWVRLARSKARTDAREDSSVANYFSIQNEFSDVPVEPVGDSLDGVVPEELLHLVR
jgi:hypothetical protein